MYFFPMIEIWVYFYHKMEMWVYFFNDGDMCTFSNDGDVELLFSMTEMWVYFFNDGDIMWKSFISTYYNIYCFHCPLS